MEGELLKKKITSVLTALSLFKWSSLNSTVQLVSVSVGAASRVYKAELIALVGVAAVIVPLTAPSEKQPAHVNKQTQLQGAVAGEPLEGAIIQTHVCERGSLLLCSAFAHHELNWAF